MGQYDNAKEITIGPAEVRVYSEDLGQSYNMGCLQRVGLRFAQASRDIICDVRDGPTDIRRMAPAVDVFMDAKELSVNNLLASLGQSVITGSDITTFQLVGPGMVSGVGAPSTTTSPAEWHIVRLSAAAGPWASTVLYAENRELDADKTDWAVYTAAYTNGDTNVAAWTPSSGGTVTLSDYRMGKFTFANLVDTDISQWTFDESDPAFTINGVRPIIEDDVQHGDTVCLIGLTYKYDDAYYDTTGTVVPATEMQIIKAPLETPKPVTIRVVHYLEDDRDRKAIVWLFHKAISDGAVDFSFGSDSMSEIVSPARFRVLNDKRNHPTSPLYQVKIVKATADLDKELVI
jgi:hypothetical protein